MASETDVELKIALNTQGVKQSARNLRKEINSIFEASAGKKMDSQMMQLQTRMSKLAGESRECTKEIERLANEKIPTEQYAQATERVQNLRKAFENAEETWQRLEAIGASQTSINQWVDKATYFEEKLKEAEKEVQKIQQEGKAFELKDNSAQIDKLTEKSKNLYNEMAVTVNKAYELDPALKQSVQDLQKMEQAGGKTPGFIDTMKEAFQRMADGAKHIPEALAGLAKSGAKKGLDLLKKGASAAAKGFLKLADGAKKALRSVGSFVKSGLGKLHSGLQKTSAGFSGGFGKILKYALGLASLRMAINKLRSAVKEGINNLAQFNNGNNETNKSLSMLQSSLVQMKNAWGTAFAPILNLVAPMLNTLIQLCTQAATAVAALFAKLSGASTFTKATAVQKDYAKSLKGTGSAAKDAAGKLAAFDDLNVLGDDSSSGGGGADLDPNQMFETVPIDDATSDFADKLKQAWADADFSDIGQIIGEKLRDGLEMIPWNRIQDAARKIASSIATLINGFIKTEGLAQSIGKTLGEAFNTAFIFLYDLITKIDWYAIGDFIGTALMEAFNTIDWDLIGATFAEKYNSIFEAMQGFADAFDPELVSNSISDGLNSAINNVNWAENGAALSDFAIDFLQAIRKSIEKVNWQQLGKDVAQFIGAIDWSTLADELFGGLGAALGGLAGFLWGLISDAWSSVVGWWYDVAYEDGKFTILGLLQGIVDVVAGIGTWIWEHIFVPFIDGFKAAFGIASPSKVMEEMGDFIMEGLLQGIIAKVQAVVQKFIELKDKIKAKLDELRLGVIEKATNIKNKAVEIVTGIKSKITDLVSSLKNKVIDIVDALWTGIKRPLNLILAGIETVANGVINGINKMINAMNSLSFDVPDWVPEIGGKTFGFNIPTLATVSLPRLAQGAVIPPNKEFMAVLGDQKSGTNIEAPLETIRQAFEDVVANMQVENTGYAEMQLDGETFARLITPYVISELSRSGYDVSVIGA